MEVEAGYKLTDAGVIPEDWDAPLLGDLFTFKNGLNKAKTFFGYGTPIVNYMDVYAKDGLFSHDLQGRVYLDKQEMKAFEVQKGDVFFTRTSETAEEVGISSVMLDEAYNTVFSGFVIRARPKEDTLDDQFKKYCFSTSSVREQITSRSTETTRALTSGKSLSAVVIARPPKAEQSTIAAALSDTDALISSLEKLIAKKRDVKKGTMQMLLTGKKRLPGFSGEWRVENVRDFGEVITGSTPSTGVNSYWNGDIPWATPTDIRTRDILQTERQITHLGLDAVRKLTHDSVLVTCIASIGKNAILRTDGACNQQINAVIPDEQHSSEFLYYLFEGSKQYLLGHAGITATNIISKSAFSEIVFAVPLLSEQTAIAEVLSDMDTELEALERKLEKHRSIKQGMMQELLTGRKRLICEN